jgi:hypothetical protein
MMKSFRGLKACNLVATNTVGMRTLTVSKTNEQLILPSTALIRKTHQDALSLNKVL